jgi:hypothetical protein
MKLLGKKGGKSETLPMYMPRHSVRDRCVCVPSAGDTARARHGRWEGVCIERNLDGHTVTGYCTRRRPRPSFFQGPPPPSSGLGLTSLPCFCGGLGRYFLLSMHARRHIRPGGHSDAGLCDPHPWMMLCHLLLSTKVPRECILNWYISEVRLGMDRDGRSKRLHDRARAGDNRRQRSQKFIPWSSSFQRH